MALHCSELSNKQISPGQHVESEPEAADGRCGRGQGWSTERECERFGTVSPGGLVGA